MVRVARYGAFSCALGLAFGYFAEWRPPGPMFVLLAIGILVVLPSALFPPLCVPDRERRPILPELLLLALFASVVIGYRAHVHQPSIVRGQYVLYSRGKVIKALSFEEYQRERAIEGMRICSFLGLVYAAESVLAKRRPTT